MAIPVIVILGLLWAAVLVPPLFKARSERRGHNSIGDFTSSLGVIGRTGGRVTSRAVPPIPQLPSGRGHAPLGGVTNGAAPTTGLPVSSAAQRRRRDVLLTLGVVVAVTFVAALLTGSMAVWAAQILADILVVTYVVLLVRMRSLAVERRAKVRYLPRQTPQLALRRAATY